MSCRNVVVSEFCYVGMALCWNGVVSEWRCVEMAICLVTFCWGTFFTVTKSLTIIYDGQIDSLISLGVTEF